MRKINTKLICILLCIVLCLTCGCQKNNVSVSSGEDTQGEESGEDTKTYKLSKAGEIIIDDVDFSFYRKNTEDNNARVFYEIFVGSFSDSNGDGIGDLRGIINRFDYLNDGKPESGTSLGIEGIWLSPIFESPTYHKYDVTDYYSIDDEFGTMDDLKELVALAHKRGVKVILDTVINHTGDQNEWFKEFCSAHRHDDYENPYYDFYCYSDSANVPGRSFKKIASDDEYYEANFSSNMPELNYDNEKVRETMLEVAKYYLEEIGVDGFRFDAAKYIYFGEKGPNIEFWKWYVGELKKIKPDIYTVGEVWDSDNMVVDYSEALNCFNFNMGQTDGQICTTTKHGDVNKYVSYVSSFIARAKQKNPDAMIIPFITNHDMDRAAGYMTVASNFAKVSANLYILGPGSPFIYYGEEIGLKGSRGSEATDANRRLKMLWGDGDTVKDPKEATYGDSRQTNGTVAEQFANENSLYNHYKKLIMIRKANPEIALGDYKPLSFADTKVGGFLATYDGKTVAVLHNTTENPQTVDLSTATDVQFSGVVAYAGVGSASLDGTVLTLEGQTSAVLR